MLSPKEVWLMQMLMQTIHSKGEGGGPNRQKKVSCLNFFHLAIKYEFYLINFPIVIINLLIGSIR